MFILKFLQLLKCIIISLLGDFWDDGCLLLALLQCSLASLGHVNSAVSMRKTISLSYIPPGGGFFLCFCCSFLLYVVIILSQRTANCIKKGKQPCYLSLNFYKAIKSTFGRTGHKILDIIKLLSQSLKAAPPPNTKDIETSLKIMNNF